MLMVVIESILGLFELLFVKNGFEKFLLLVDMVIIIFWLIRWFVMRV